MSQQPYDRAYDLARSIRSSSEYQRVKETREQVEQNSDYLQILQDYRRLQAELQSVYLQEEQPSVELQQKAERLTSEVQQAPALAEYIEAQDRFMILLQDIQRIVLEPMEEVVMKGER